MQKSVTIKSIKPMKNGGVMIDVGSTTFEINDLSWINIPSVEMELALVRVLLAETFEKTGSIQAAVGKKIKLISTPNVSLEVSDG